MHYPLLSATERVYTRNRSLLEARERQIYVANLTDMMVWLRPIVITYKQHDHVQDVRVGRNDW